MYIKSLTIAAVVSTVAAQNATAPSFCDKYTTALFMNNTAENQLKLLTAVVNTAVIGNCESIDPQSYKSMILTIHRQRVQDRQSCRRYPCEGRIHGRGSRSPSILQWWSQVEQQRWIKRRGRQLSRRWWSCSLDDGHGIKRHQLSSTVHIPPQQSSSTITNSSRLLLTHLYEYFGSLLQCSQQGGKEYPAYAGFGSQYDVHKYVFPFPHQHLPLNTNPHP